MPGNHDMVHAILIITPSDQFAAIVKRSLRNFVTIDVRKSGVLARRAILERDYDIVVIDVPLPDETGEELALDITERSRAGVLMVVAQDAFEDVTERVTDHGVMAMPKPFPRDRADRAIRFLAAVQMRMRQLERRVVSVEDKMEELRLVSKAKLLLMEKKGMTENEAHRYLVKQAMNDGLSKKLVAEQVLEDLEVL
ncbi:MAG: ANTAR domain-containing protein [Butyrivibrio sp.]|nr:ANTAR domain-containing protein [Butyrivibrio sp.]